jgi:hypothetical protein
MKSQKQVILDRGVERKVAGTSYVGSPTAVRVSDKKDYRANKNLRKNIRNALKLGEQ